MPLQVVNSAVLMCSFGVAPSSLTVLPTNMVKCGNQPAANIMDHKPNVNIMPFGMCTTPSNPQVAAATSAAMGVLTPVPCVPVTTAPWTPGVPKVMIANQPSVDNTCTCMCNWGGVITIAFAGQVTTMIP
jgi:hypothetical protein